MDKRTFLKNLGLVTASTAVPQIFLSSCATSANDDSQNASGKVWGKHWVWMGADKEASDQELRDRFAKLVDNGITGIHIGGDDERMFKLAKEVGMSTHLWTWTMNRRDPFIMDNHPDWYAVNRNGESCWDKPQYVDYYRWLCPSKPEVYEYLEEDYAKLASKDYIDGIQLDYVRYCDVILPRALWEKYDIVQNEELPPYDYCYCDTCRTKFKSEQGYDPLDIKDPSVDEKWIQFRYDSVTSIVNRLAKVVHGSGKILSAAVFPTPTVARKLVRQDWDKWDLDMVFPMIYHGFYNEPVDWIGECVNEDLQAVGERMEVFAGLYLPDFAAPQHLADAVELTKSNAASGISLFGNVSDQHWTAFKNSIGKK